ncbi:MAG: SpoIID/LytB domain-containing protein [Candidatus Marinimicrobia bacterium]|jgi:stage II sporulation protein D|nr:SpoIID/LytB domain-containing protein [Candidatus Neomarinimicrobiota bacterium]MBT4714261.1 SpoIID/LytB domain-containing protein [Candidatus Neomarinimicrobiota bacterium]MBT4946727.1 SpoIID/LytB domain-containing protein [Candidatus Neomarinimicrobiota bacterium]MBT5269134.1 SpoIID/LytB domain-containing protein [Candidatus Neomarinimicrobiota bacterium]MBT6011131.1 SpoIID/LytB domain-containing protein [Candidatus Neomarinimicrobiota bacterium]
MNTFKQTLCHRRGNHPNIKRLLLIALVVGSGWTQQLFNQEPEVRVRIINTLDTLNISLMGEWSFRNTSTSKMTLPVDSQIQLINRAGQISVFDTSGALLAKTPSFMFGSNSDTSTIGIASVPYGVGWWWAGVEDRIYEGAFHVYIGTNQEMNVVVQLPLETYLKGVVPYEIGGTSPLEALKAQAVSARSEAIIALTSKLYSGEYYDLTSDVECQVFSGNKKRTYLSDQAVDETAGLIISEGGQPMNAYYASNCGGRAELIKNVWPGRNRLESYQVSLPDNDSRKGPSLKWSWRARRWIKSSPDVYCNPDSNTFLPGWSKKNFRWSREFSNAELTDMLTDDKKLGMFKRIRVLKRGSSGRIYKARLVFERGKLTIDGELTLRQLFSPSLRSSAFYVKREGNKIVLYGAGWGHGVGMCQSGAVAMATKGSTFDQILKHYYLKAGLLNIYGD